MWKKASLKTFSYIGSQTDSTPSETKLFFNKSLGSSCIHETNEALFPFALLFSKSAFRNSPKSQTTIAPYAQIEDSEAIHELHAPLKSVTKLPILVAIIEPEEVPI